MSLHTHASLKWIPILKDFSIHQCRKQVNEETRPNNAKTNNKTRSTNNEEQEEENKKKGSSSIKTCSKMVYEYERVCVYGIPLKWVAIMTRHCYLS